MKQKLATLWASFMFLYIYTDYFHSYMPGKMNEIQHGIVFEFSITQKFLLAAPSLATIPILLIFLCVSLPAKINRWTNIVVATLHVPYILFNLTGETWSHMVFAAAAEVVLLFLIIQYAWKWPRV